MEFHRRFFFHKIEILNFRETYNKNNLFTTVRISNTEVKSELYRLHRPSVKHFQQSNLSITNFIVPIIQ